MEIQFIPEIEPPNYWPDNWDLTPKPCACCDKGIGQHWRDVEENGSRKEMVCYNCLTQCLRIGDCKKEAKSE